jgi:uncharacterized membrane protein
MDGLSIHRDDIMTMLPAKRIALIGIFVSLSLVGSFIKIPSPLGSPALDSAPGYFSSLAFGPVEGFIVAFLGHLITSMTAGFPLGILHVFIGVGMGICAILFRVCYEKWNSVTAVICGVVLNGVVLPLVVIPSFGIALYWGILPSLLIASILNICISAGIYVKIKDRITMTR